MATKTNLSSHDEYAIFLQHVEQVRFRFMKLDYLIQTALYYDINEFRSGNQDLAKRFPSEEIDEACESEELMLDDDRGEYAPNYQHSVVAKALSSLEELQRFLESSSQTFRSKYCAKHHYEPSLRYVRLWEAFLFVGTRWNG